VSADQEHGLDLDAETVQRPTAPEREPITHAERTRRGLLATYGVLLLVFTGLQVWLGMTLPTDDYQAVSGPLGGAVTVFAAALGAAGIYYWTPSD
jgi:hypothetical protein